MRIVIVLMTLWASNVMALDFKGVVMGSVATDAQLAGLTGYVDIEGVQVKSTVSTEADGTVSKIDIEFLPWQFDVLAGAALRKWGKPTSTARLVMQNGFGAQLLNPVRTWDRGGWSVTIFKYIDGDSGELTIERKQPAKTIAPESRM